MNSYPIGEIVLASLRKTRLTNPQIEGARVVERFNAELEILARQVLDPKARVDAYHSKLVGAFKRNLKALRKWKKNARTRALIARAIERIEQERARVAAAA